MTYMGSKCANLCHWLNMCKNVPETVQWIKKSSNFVKFQTKAQKCSKVHFVREIWCSNREIGRFDEKLGDSQENRESWQVWHKHVQNLEKATDLFQIINKVNINSLFVENILCLCQFLGCRGENQQHTNCKGIWTRTKRDQDVMSFLSHFN